MRKNKKNEVEWEKVEAIREEEEFQARKKQMKIDRQMAAEAEKKKAADKKAIEDTGNG